jgi:hypothetical protein
MLHLLLAFLVAGWPASSSGCSAAAITIITITGIAEPHAQTCQRRTGDTRDLRTCDGAAGLFSSGATTGGRSAVRF